MPNEIEVTTAPPPAVLADQAAPAPATWAPAAPAGLPMPIPVAQIVGRMTAVKQIVKEVLEDGVHYGYAFGDAKTGSGKDDKKNRKCLLKPGFDVLCLTFQFQPDYQEMAGTIVRQDFILVVYKCTLTHIPSGKVIATGIGSANSKEEKYRWKPGSANQACPDCGGEYILKSKDRPEYFCWKKKGGCGAVFPLTDTRITSQIVERKENDNAYNHHNTLVKIAQKRAGIAAIIPACGLSNEFTQDLEDIAENQRAAQAPRDEWASAEEAEYRPAPVAEAQGTPAKPAERPFTAQEVHDAVKESLAACKTVEGLSAFKSLVVQKAKTNSLWFTEHVKEMLAAKHRELTASKTAPEFSEADLDLAVEGVQALLKDCKTDEDFARVRDNCKAEGGRFHHPRVVQTVNAAYRAAFPELFHPNGERKVANPA